MQPLLSNWFIGIQPSEKEEVEKIIRNSTIVRDQLTKHLEHELRNKEANPVADYDNPNWAYKQADRLGEIRVLRNLLKMVRLERTHL